MAARQLGRGPTLSRGGLGWRDDLLEAGIVAAIAGLLLSLARQAPGTPGGAAAARSLEQTEDVPSTLYFIAAAEEAYRAEFSAYKTCVADSDSTGTKHVRTAWRPEWGHMNSAEFECWRQLGVRSRSQQVSHLYAVTAGPAGPVIAPRPAGVAIDDWPFNGSIESAEPYYVAVAFGGNDARAWYFSSLKPEVVSIETNP